MTALREAQRQALQDSTGQLGAASTRAVEALHEVLDDPGAPAAARVSASRVILDSAFKFLELQEVAERMTEIETALALHGGEDGASKDRPSLNGVHLPSGAGPTS
jgi:hypothetical protein